MGPTIIDLASERIFFPKYNVQQIPMIVQEPTNESLPLHLAVPASNKMMQARASVNIKGVHAAVNSIMIRHVQPVLEVRANRVTTPWLRRIQFQDQPYL